MIAWYWAVIALFAGTFFGWLLCALCVAFRDSEENQARPGERKGER